MSVAVRRLGVSLFVDKRPGEIEIANGGEARPAQGLTSLLYGRGIGSAAIVARDPDRSDRTQTARTEEPAREERPLPAVTDDPPPPPDGTELEVGHAPGEP